MLDKIYAFATPLFLCLIGLAYLGSKFGITNADEKDKMENLIKNGEQVIGFLDPQYEESTTKIRGARIKTYTMFYSFEVNGKTYKGSHGSDRPPSQATIPVTYLKSDPNINASNPRKKLARINSETDSNQYLWFGLAALLGGIGLGYYRYRQYYPKKDIWDETA